MTGSGTSTRPSMRPSKRSRGEGTETKANVPPPVLFRLPSIGNPVSPVQGAMPGMAAVSASTATMSMPAASAEPVATAAVAQTPAPVVAPRESKFVQKLLNLLVLIIVLAAVAAIAMMAMRRPTNVPELADSKSSSPTKQDPLNSLTNLEVPLLPSEIVSGQSASALPASTAVATDSNSKSGLASVALQKPQPSSSESGKLGKQDVTPDSLILSLDSSELARKSASSNTTSNNAAQVQLGIPIPVLDEVTSSSNRSNLVDSRSNTSSNDSNIPLSTPKYETVSTPTKSEPSQNQTSNSGASPSLYDGSRNAPTNDLNLSSGLSLSPDKLAPSKATSSPVDPRESPTSSLDGLTLSQNNGTTKAASSPAFVPSKLASQNVDTQPSGALASSNSTSASNTSSAGTQPLGVTVGAGMPEPTNLATATPDIDVAAISRKYLEYSQQKTSVAANTKETATAGANNANSYAAQSNATYGAALAPYVRSAPVGVTAGTLSSYAGSDAGQANPYAQNAPTSAQPTGNAPQTNNAAQFNNAQSTTAQRPNTTPLNSYSLPPNNGYSASNTVQNPYFNQPAQGANNVAASNSPAAPTNNLNNNMGYAIPPRSMPNGSMPNGSMPSSVGGAGAGNNMTGTNMTNGYPNTTAPGPYSMAGYATNNNPQYPTGNVMPAGPAPMGAGMQGAPGTQYGNAPATYPNPNMQNMQSMQNMQNPGLAYPNNQQQGAMPGMGQPMQPSYGPQTYTNPNAGMTMPQMQAMNYPTNGYPAANGYPANPNVGMQANRNAQMTAPQVRNPYPGGQIPTGMIGQSGYATAPTGDIAPPRPVMGTMGGSAPGAAMNR